MTARRARPRLSYSIILSEAGSQVKHYFPKVFVVDDDPAVLNSTQALLAAHGYDVRCFISAEAFLAQHHPTQVGCILIDLRMPGMGGCELLQRLRHTRSLLSPVIVSGLVDSMALVEHEEPDVPILAKPYDLQTFLAMIEDGISDSMWRRGEQLKGRPGG
jgi:FixJ family two-component response regulator